MQVLAETQQQLYQVMAPVCRCPRPTESKNKIKQGRGAGKNQLLSRSSTTGGLSCLCVRAPYFEGTSARGSGRAETKPTRIPTELVTMQISKSTEDFASCICRSDCGRITRRLDGVSTTSYNGAGAAAAAAASRSAVDPVSSAVAVLVVSSRSGSGSRISWR